MKSVAEQLEHVIVLMLENRSFDQMLGTLTTAEPVDGIRSDMTNPDQAGQEIAVHLTSDPSLTPSPRHDLDGVRAQLEGPNRGFVTNYETVVGGGAATRRNVMAYYDGSINSLLHKLAQEYAVSDRWFCSIPAETWPNRFFAHAGTSGGHIANDWGVPWLYGMRTIYDELGDDWANYCDLLPQVACFFHLGMEWLTNRHQPGSRFRSLRQFGDDAREGRLPRYAFVEPVYVGPNADDDHPPHDLFRGEALVAEVYNALRSGPLWPKSLLVITFDEHGGFFDHCPPPDGVPAPGDTGPRAGFDFRSLGPRVPCVLVSPLIRPGRVIRPPAGGFFDHSSLIATVTRRWSLHPLTKRDAAASDLLPFLDVAGGRKDDDSVRSFVGSWEPAAHALDRRLAMEHQAAEAAPLGRMDGRSGRDVATALTELAVRNERRTAAGAVGLNELEADTCALAGRLLELADRPKKPRKARPRAPR